MQVKVLDMRKLIAAFALVGFFVYMNPAMAEMASTNYQIRWDSLTEGGSDTSTSANYGIHDSVGGAALGNSNSTNYQVDSGYRAGLFDQVITFDVLLQNTTSSYTVTSRSGLTVSMTNTSGISVGQYIVLVQDLGASQVSAIGKVTSIVTNTSVTVDSWSDNGTTPTIDGANDVLFLLNGSSVSLGQLESSIVSTAIVGYEVNADLASGYSVQVLAGGTFTSGSYVIPNVTDGTVTAGVEEYGARSSDTSIATSTFDTQDDAITTTAQDVTTESAKKFQDRHFLTLKASRVTGTPSGTYAQTITLIASGNF